MRAHFVFVPGEFSLVSERLTLWTFAYVRILYIYYFREDKENMLYKEK